MTAFKNGRAIILVGAILVVGFTFAAEGAASPEPTPTPTPWHQPRDNYWCPPPEDADPQWLSICERMEDLKACWYPPVERVGESPCCCGQETPTPTPAPTPTPTTVPLAPPATLPQTGGSP